MSVRVAMLMSVRVAEFFFEKFYFPEFVGYVFCDLSIFFLLFHK